MVNRKIKGNRVYDNLRAREFWDCSERNLCAVWLALLDMGESKKTVLKIDEEFHEASIKQFRQDAQDEVIDERFDRWLDSVGITRRDIDNTASRFYNRLSLAFTSRDGYAIAIDVLQTDLIAILYQLNMSLGYGKKRLGRILDFIKNYNGDEKEEVARLLNIHYPPPDTLPDITDLYQRRRKERIERERANKYAAKMLHQMSG